MHVWLIFFCQCYTYSIALLIPVNIIEGKWTFFSSWLFSTNFECFIYDKQFFCDFRRFLSSFSLRKFATDHVTRMWGCWKTSAEHNWFNLSSQNFWTNFFKNYLNWVMEKMGNVLRFWFVRARKPHSQCMGQEVLIRLIFSKKNLQSIR